MIGFRDRFLFPFLKPDMSNLNSPLTFNFNPEKFWNCCIVRVHAKRSCARTANQSPIAELSFVTLTIHLCNGLNDKNLVKPRKTCFLPF